jgi:hypothetical protein
VAHLGTPPLNIALVPEQLSAEFPDQQYGRPLISGGAALYAFSGSVLVLRQNFQYLPGSNVAELILIEGGGRMVVGRFVGATVVAAGVVLPNSLGGNSFSVIRAKKEDIPFPAESTHFAPETWTMSSEDIRIMIAVAMKP